ncbi:MAG: antitoxin [Francisella endosymbiont of Hyalomma asiaticum]
MLTKLFRNGNSQAVKIPKEMQFRVKEVEINHIGNSIITKPPKKLATDLCWIRKF